MRNEMNGCPYRGQLYSLLKKPSGPPGKGRNRPGFPVGPEQAGSALRTIPGG